MNDINLKYVGYIHNEWQRAIYCEVCKRNKDGYEITGLILRDNEKSSEVKLSETNSFYACETETELSIARAIAQKISNTYLEWRDKIYFISTDYCTACNGNGLKYQACVHGHIGAGNHCVHGKTYKHD